MPDFNAESIRKHLKTKTFGQKVHFLPLTDSTQIVAVKLAGEGAEEGVAVVADEQVAGRGRHEHSWESPPGVNLYFSLVFRPKGWSLLRANEIQFLCAVSAAHALDKQCGLSVELKWPNDIWANGKKIGGLILSTTADSAGAIDYVVMGMGLNLNAAATQFSGEVQNLASSVQMLTGKPVQRPVFFARLLQEIEKNYHDVRQKNFEPIREAWLSLAPGMTGKEVRVSDVMTVPGAQRLAEVRGISRGIDANGHLLVQTADGRALAIADGKLEK